MGCNCNCLHKDQEANNEMVGGIIPGLGIKDSKKDDMLLEIKNIHTENDNREEEEDKNNISNINNNSLNQDENKNEDDLRQDIEIDKKEEEKKISNYQTRITPGYNSDDSDASTIQELYESIFEYFNDIRTDPEQYEKVAEDHGVLDIIQKVINNPCNNLIINSFYNLLLSSYINENTADGEDNKNILEEIDKEEKIKNFNKSLFVIDGDINNSNEVIWKLIENNKDNAYETFFSNKIDCLVISCKKTHEKNKFKCYFLFLSKKN